MCSVRLYPYPILNVSGVGRTYFVTSEQHSELCKVPLNVPLHRLRSLAEKQTADNRQTVVQLYSEPPEPLSFNG